MATDVEILLRAAQEAGLTQDQMRGLSIANPWQFTSPTAQRLQSAVSRLYPERARQWLDESGREMSLLAAAARDGLVEMTSDLRAEIQAFTPLTPDQARAAEIESLLANGNPFGAQGRYAEDGSYTPPVAGDMTKALRLQILDPAKAEQLKLQANPPQATGMSQDAVNYVNAQMANARIESRQVQQGALN